MRQWAGEGGMRGAIERVRGSGVKLLITAVFFSSLTLLYFRREGEGRGKRNSSKEEDEDGPRSGGGKEEVR